MLEENQVVKGESGIRVEMIEDSVSQDGTRLSTMQLIYPRFFHAELMTHRMFSRNAASSRAIPTRKIIKQVWDNPAMPVKWQKNQRGMQSSSDLPSVKKKTAKTIWKGLSKVACSAAWLMSKMNVHKQWVNRILEPWQYIHVIVTATEFENFFNLRYHKDAQPEIYELARCMKEALNNSNPKVLNPGNWHLPYVEDFLFSNEENEKLLNSLKESTARCARVSYKNHDKTEPDPEKDHKLHDMLLSNGHMSPFEHQATPMETGEFWEDGMTHIDKNNVRWSGNFRDWIQYRNQLHQ